MNLLLFVEWFSPSDMSWTDFYLQHSSTNRMTQERVCYVSVVKTRSSVTEINLFFSRMKKKESDKDEDVKEEERELKDRRCFQCGDMGHVRRDCPEYRHLKQRPVGAQGSPNIQRHQIT